MPRVNIPQPGMNVSMGPTEENPGGRVVNYLPGWVELDEEMSKNSVLKNLIKEDDSEQQRQIELYEAEQERNKAVSDSQMEYYAKSVEMDEKRNEEMRTKEEERAKKIEDAMKEGRNEMPPHPDPVAQWSMALTATPMLSASGAAGQVPAASMVSKLPDASPPPLPGQSTSSATGVAGGTGDTNVATGSSSAPATSTTGVVPASGLSATGTGTTGPTGTSGSSGSSAGSGTGGANSGPVVADPGRATL